jgi:hypothetical protein
LDETIQALSFQEMIFWVCEFPGYPESNPDLRTKKGTPRFNLHPKRNSIGQANEDI